MSNSTPLDTKTNSVQLIGLVAGIVFALLTYYAMPHDPAVLKQMLGTTKKLNLEAMPLVASVSVLMGIWWMTEAIELPATALLPLVVFTALGVDSFNNIGASYGSSVIFLFMGGFILALAMQKWNLHTRIALGIVLLLGTSPRRLIAGFMIATGFLSMWVSNTATAVMMLPVGLSVLHLVAKLMQEKNSEEFKAKGDETEDIEYIQKLAQQSVQGGALNIAVHKGKDIIQEVKEKTNIYRTNFGISLMLGIAYSASIGSLGTIIGTPPNALLVGFMRETYGIEIGFGEWMLVGVPLSVVMMAIAWAMLTYVIFPLKIKEIPGGRAVIKKELDKLGPLSRPELLVSLVFFTAAFCWVFLGTILKKNGISIKSLDSIVAMSISVLLFIIPANKQGDRLVDWDTVKKLPWDILLLFGGGLALSAQFTKTGLSLWIGHQVSALGSLPIVLIIILVTALVIFLTEITSNTATAAAFLPVIGGVALGLGYENVNILLFTIPVALAATCAFMLPVATPPNAIAYGSGYVNIGDMIKAGIWLNIIGIMLIAITTYLLATAVFGLSI